MGALLAGALLRAVGMREMFGVMGGGTIGLTLLYWVVNRLVLDRLGRAAMVLRPRGEQVEPEKREKDAVTQM